MGLLKIRMLCALLAAAAGELTAQSLIDVGAEVWIEPEQTNEEREMWFSRLADNKMRSATARL